MSADLVSFLLGLATIGVVGIVGYPFVMISRIWTRLQHVETKYASKAELDAIADEWRESARRIEDMIRAWRDDEMKMLRQSRENDIGELRAELRDAVGRHRHNSNGNGKGGR